MLRLLRSATVAVVSAGVTSACWYDLGSLSGGEPAPDGGAPVDAAAPAEGGPDTLGVDGSIPLPPVELVTSGQSGLAALAASATDLYWTTASPNGAVKGCALGPCPSPRVVRAGGTPGPIVYGDRLFWAEDALLWSQEGSSAAASCDPLGGIASVAMSGSSAYYAKSDGKIVKMQGWPCSSDSILPGAAARFVTAQGSALAWITPDETIRFCGSTGCAAAGDLVAAGESPVALVLDTAYVFWTTADGRIRRAPHDGKKLLAAAGDLATGLPGAAGLAPEPTGLRLFVTSRGTPAKNFVDGSVVVVSKAGGGIGLVARDQVRPEAVVVAKDHVYWASSLDGSIRRAPVSFP